MTKGSAYLESRQGVLWAALGALGAVTLTVSQTVAAYGDEGFHLVAAQLILAGRKPYVDFFYQQPPVYAYLNAAWMRVFGATWRSAHVFSVLLTAACGVLIARYVFMRVQETQWRTSCAIAAALLFHLSYLVLWFGTIGQPYALCLLLEMAAFRLATAAVRRTDAVLVLLSGLAAGLASSSSLLTASAAPILLGWILWRSKAGGRLSRGLAFLAGAAIGLAPLLWVAATAPRQVLFDVFQFHLFYRRLGASWSFDFMVVTSWLSSAQGLLLATTAAVGLLRAKHEADDAFRAEAWLCAWLVAGQALYLATAHPTFVQYFILILPFAAILGALGLPELGSLLRARPAWALGAVACLFAVGLARAAYEERMWLKFPLWPHYERLAREVKRVTPPGGLICADEVVYFAGGILPPPGQENLKTQAIQELPAELAAALRIVPRKELEARIARGFFDTVAICNADEAWLEEFGLPRLYARRSRVDGCSVFWERASR